MSDRRTFAEKAADWINGDLCAASVPTGEPSEWEPLPDPTPEEAIRNRVATTAPYPLERWAVVEIDTLRADLSRTRRALERWKVARDTLDEVGDRVGETYDQAYNEEREAADALRSVLSFLVSRSQINA